MPPKSAIYSFNMNLVSVGGRMHPLSHQHIFISNEPSTWYYLELTPRTSTVLTIRRAAESRKLLDLMVAIGKQQLK